MAQEKSFYLLETLRTLPVEDGREWLGRVVEDYRSPISSYAPTNTKPMSDENPPPFEITVDPNYSNVRGTIESFASTGLYADALNLFGVSSERFEKDKTEFESAEVTRLRVHNDKDVLKYTCSRLDVADRLQEWRFGIGSCLYLVVGVLLTNGISYHTIAEQHADVSGSLDVAKAAAAAAAAAAGATLPPIQLRAGAEDDQSASQKLKIRAVGKRIFAIEYRQFRRKLRSRTGTQPALKRRGLRGDRMFAGAGDESPNLGLGDMDDFVELDEDPLIDLVGGDDAYCRFF